MMTSNHEVRRPTRIRSVERASDVLFLLAGQSRGRTAAAIADELGLNVATTHHLLNTLAGVGLAVKDDARRYWLGPRVLLLARGLVHQPVPHHLTGPLHALAARTGETAYLAAWPDDEIRALASVGGVNAVRVVDVERGPYHHAHARATGKLLLAYARPRTRDAYLSAHPPQRLTPRTICDSHSLATELARIRKQGYAEDHEEFVEGVCCVSAPALVDGVAVAAYTVSAPAQRYHRDAAALLDAVRAAASAAVESTEGSAT